MQTDGIFAFAVAQPSGALYAVTIKSAPLELQCSVPIGAGTIPSAVIDTLRVRCVVPGALPVRDREQSACVALNDAFSTHKSQRKMVFDARPDANGGVSYFASKATYANAVCTGERRVLGAGKPLGASFSTLRTQTAANRSVYWGTKSNTGILTGLANATILVRQNNQLCILSDLQFADFPDSASLDAWVSSAIAQGLCYTPC